MRPLLLFALLSAGLGSNLQALDEFEQHPLGSHLPGRRKKNTNKFNLSEEELELISHMTPKEKKEFFRSRG